MKKIIGTLLLMCLVYTVNAQLLWKISGNGLSQPSYLFGTHHLAPLSILESTPGFKSAFDSSKQVIGEMVMSDMQTPEAIQAMQKKMIISSDTTLLTLLTPAEFEIVNEFTKKNMMLDLNVMPKLKPSFISNNAAVMVYMEHLPDYDPAQQLDTQLQTDGITAGKKIIGLETLDYQLSALFDSAPLSRQAELLMCIMNDQDGNFQKAKMLTDAYLKKDLNKVMALATRKTGTKCDATPAEFAALADTRNIAWMKQLPGMMKQAPSFIAVGALHLPGDNGLISLLKKAGYTVEPVK